MASDGTAGTTWATAPTRHVAVGADRFAYRELGPTGGVPVVCFVHLAAVLDNWDPQVIDPLAADRHVIAFQWSARRMSSSVFSELPGPSTLSTSSE